MPISTKILCPTIEAGIATGKTAGAGGVLGAGAFAAHAARHKQALNVTSRNIQLPDAVIVKDDVPVLAGVPFISHAVPFTDSAAHDGKAPLDTVQVTGAFSPTVAST